MASRQISRALRLNPCFLTLPTKAKISLPSNRFYSTDSPNQQPQRTQTPLQSQTPPVESAGPVPHQPVQTPIQTQTPPNIMAAPQSASPIIPGSFEHQQQLQRRYQQRQQQQQQQQYGQPPPGLPRPLFWQVIAAIVLLPPGIYWYWGYRKEHMDRKRADLIAKARERAAGQG